MKLRRGLSPVVASILLVAVGLVLGTSVSLFISETGFSNVRVEAVELSYIYCSTQTSVSNARWKIVLNLINRGTQSVQINNVFVNDAEINLYGMEVGDNLSNGKLIGSSMPVEGINLQSGEGKEIFLWIGENLFSSGTVLNIKFNEINNVTLEKTIKLS